MLEIKVKVHGGDLCTPAIIKKGEWIDLMSAEDVELKTPIAHTLVRKQRDLVRERYREVSFDTRLISLGVSMQLPKGFEAVIVPRSSTFKHWGICMANSQGVIDNSYQGDGDIWKFPAIAFRATKISVGDRICQFRIQPSQKASIWQKMRWLFSSGVRLVEVKSLNSPNRGGIGSTGRN